MPGFRFEDNGLFEVKLISTAEGLLFVNFSSGTIDIPFVGFKSSLPTRHLHCAITGVSIDTTLNWKVIANDFKEQAKQAETHFDWAQPWRKQKVVRLLDPLSLLRELEEGLWCTISIIPKGPRATVVKFDILNRASTVVPVTLVSRWKARLEQEIQSAAAKSRGQSASFTYECGGRMIELSAILDQQVRIESMSGTKSRPMLRFTGTENFDFEAEALADTLDRQANLACSMKSICSRAVEW
ncbi:hypothetical protein LTS08_005257 [Lithohypha guttulata]|nr:hypothetical protein LTS08_005257 [Lithohypha guttulata]